MKRSLFAKMSVFAVVPLLALGLTACFGDDEDTDGTDDSSVDGDNTDDDNTDDDNTDDDQEVVTVISGESSFSAVAGNYRLVAYNSAETSGSAGFTVGLGQEAARKALRSEQASLISAKWDGRLALDRLMRERGSRLARAGFARAQGIKLEAASKLHTRSTCGENEVERGGSCVSTFSLAYDVTDTPETVSVTVRGVGSRCYVVVDDVDAQNVSDADVADIVDKFDSVLSVRDEAVFGSPVIDGTNYADVDGDGLQMIVLTSRVLDLDAVGFFNPSDFVGDGGNGNESDILWVVTPSDEIPLESVYGTVAHEYFHLLHYAIKAQRYGQDEDVFLSESLAHLSEDCSGYGSDNVDTVWSYLDSAASTTWAFSDDSIESRGMGYLFMRYLFEQKGGVSYSGATVNDNGGAAFLSAVVDTEKLGFEAVDAALGSSWTGYFPKWIAAVELDGTDSETSVYGYTDLYEDTVSGQYIGACTNCTRPNTSAQDTDFAGFSSEEIDADYEGSVDATGLVSLSVSFTDGQAVTTGVDSDDVAFVLISKD